jgi:hypothetical protein
MHCLYLEAPLDELREVRLQEVLLHDLQQRLAGRRVQQPSAHLHALLREVPQTRLEGSVHHIRRTVHAVVRCVETIQVGLNKSQYGLPAELRQTTDTDSKTFQRREPLDYLEQSARQQYRSTHTSPSTPTCRRRSTNARNRAVSYTATSCAPSVAKYRTESCSSAYSNCVYLQGNNTG